MGPSSACVFRQVVGGADKGGIIVREDVGLSSAACAERLATGAKVKDTPRHAAARGAIAYVGEPQGEPQGDPR